VKKTIIILLAFAFTLSYAQEKTAEELAKMSQNPLANMMSFPFQNNTVFGVGDFERTTNVLNIQPVLPFFDGKLITRTIIPLASKPVGESETLTGIGDISFSAFYAPTPKNGLTWGVGPIVVIPTGNDVSSKKWSIGPSLLVLKMEKKWVYGFLVNNVWSVGGDENANDINSMLIQYFINYNFPGGWYLSSAPIITANWEAPEGEQWVVPFGGGGGKIIKIGKLPLNLQAQVFYDVAKSEGKGNMSLRLQAQIMLPK